MSCGASSFSSIESTSKTQKQSKRNNRASRLAKGSSVTFPSASGDMMMQCQQQPSQASNNQSQFRETNKESDIEVGDDCNENFTLSGSNPPKTVGPLTRCHDIFAKYAPCGHWSTCKKNDCGKKKYFDACKSCKDRSELNLFKLCNNCETILVHSTLRPLRTLDEERTRQVYFSNERSIYNIAKRTKQKWSSEREFGENLPMGKLAPWPLSGSCRYGGRPFGPCRPFGPFKSRGPFGVWLNKTWPVSMRPCTPKQPCWMPRKRGYRPCTPCHRPLCRPCKVTDLLTIMCWSNEN